jgi:hypothetical protein
MIQTVWKSDDTQNITEDIVESFAEESRPKIRNNIRAFLNSASVMHLDFKTKGNVDVPHFNIYATGQFILDDDVWFYLRESLATLPYASPMHGRGSTVTSPSNCGICHGVDHPTEMCKFPGKDGWNGPTRETLAESSPQNRGKYSSSTCNYRQTRF